MGSLASEARVERPLDEVFAFFADALNLEALTPPWLRFRVVTPPPIEMRVGARIDYRLRVHGVPVRWQSEITSWDPPRAFVDEQRRGPYRRWRHEHRFEQAGAAATVVRDAVEYAAPGGRLVEQLLVARDLDRIFRYRRERLAQLLAPGKPA